MLLKALALAALSLILATARAADDTKPSAAKPNIIFILADDVGLGDVGFSGGHFKTPHIDALAKSGTHFTHCYAMPLCGPSRCMLLTGRYPFRTGLVGNQSAQALATHKEIMMPTVLKTAGYVSACVGKWGQMPFGPAQWGFDESLSFHGSGQYWKTAGGSYFVNGQPKALAEGEYLPDLMHTFVTGFLERHKDQPFYLYYPMDHIHGPILKTPDSKDGATKDELYADNVAYMDKLVGQLMAELDRLKLREKTLVLFVGDNGTAVFGESLATVDGKPISGRKGSMLEGGARVPLAISWPGTTPAGKVSHDLIDFSDFFPTFAEMAGAKLPDGVTIDGHSFLPQLKGQPGTPREWAYVELDGKNYVTSARWKLRKNGDLLDMKEAPFKEIPVARDTTDPEAIAARTQLQAALDKLTGPTPPAPPAAGLTPAQRAARRALRQQQRAQPAAPPAAQPEA